MNLKSDLKGLYVKKVIIIGMLTLSFLLIALQTAVIVAGPPVGPPYDDPDNTSNTNFRVVPTNEPAGESVYIKSSISLAIPARY
ncbi:MAG: hypothetical protein ACFFD4_17180 [Candidatus Odinarchaeota archaeon]